MFKKELIPRIQYENLAKLVAPAKVVILYGPRQVGKTTILKKYLDDSNEDYLFFTGDDFEHKSFLVPSLEKLKMIVGSKKLLAIDEAQKIENIGLVLKILVDNIEGLKIIVTGSSTFDLSNKVSEPLTGRKQTLYIYPIAQIELSKVENIVETKTRLEQRLIYGSYPKIVRLEDIHEKQNELKELVNSYLFQDILNLEGLKNSKTIYNILKLLAYQIGSPISLSEIGQKVGMDVEAVTRYLDLLEKSFVIFERSGFSRNLRKEITKKKKYYFYDVGVRNALINNFNLIEARDGRELGTLWENYVIAERLKFTEYLRFVKQIQPLSYFWRNYEEQEIDLIEDLNGEIFAFEIKYTEDCWKPPLDWQRNYPDAKNQLINKDNYLEFIC